MQLDTCPPGGSPAWGTIKGTPLGHYVAPQIPPPGATVAITAVSQVDPTQVFCISVTLTFGNGSLLGSYAFSTSGRVTSTNTFFARVGSFTAANGTITGGIEDVNPQPPGITTLPPIPFTGSYSIGPDGRGTMQFCEPSTSGVCTASPTSQFRIVVLSAQQVQIIEFSSPNSTTAPTAASGEIDLLDSSAYTLGTGGLSGTYSFSFAGLSSATTPQSEVGEFSANGNGAITSGKVDVNGAGEITSSSVTAGGTGYAVNDTGTITTANGNATYIVDTVSGGGAVLTFTLTSGGTGYSVGAGNTTAEGGAQPGSGTGFTVDILTIDGEQNILSTSSYLISSNGRGTATIITTGGTFHFSFTWFRRVGRSSLNRFVSSFGWRRVQTADNILGATMRLAPTTLFVFETAGSGPSGGIADLVSFTSDGDGNVVAGGMLDQNSGGAATSVPSLGAGSYIIATDSTGRGTLSIPGHS